MTAAIMLFSNRGCGLVSMCDIAAEIGIRVASTYSDFPSKNTFLIIMSLEL